jgi:hypothetical protein
MLCKIFIDESKEMHDYFFACEFASKKSMFNDVSDLLNKNKVCLFISDEKNHFNVFYNQSIIKLPKSLFYYEILIN